MNIKVNEHLHIEIWTAAHVEPTFKIIETNRNFLRQWLAFVDNMQTVEQMQTYSKCALQRNADGLEAGFVIYANEQLVGRIGINRIVKDNGIGEIGYWLIEA